MFLEQLTAVVSLKPLSYHYKSQPHVQCMFSATFSRDVAKQHTDTAESMHRKCGDYYIYLYVAINCAAEVALVSVFFAMHVHSEARTLLQNLLLL